MSHPCPDCSGQCWCSGDWDDCDVSLTPDSCEGCNECSEYAQAIHAEFHPPGCDCDHCHDECEEP